MGIGNFGTKFAIPFPIPWKRNCIPFLLEKLYCIPGIATPGIAFTKPLHGTGNGGARKRLEGHGHEKKVGKGRREGHVVMTDESEYQGRKRV